MGSSGRYSLAAFLAILEADLSGLFRSKLTLGWFAVAIFLEVVRVLSSAGPVSQTLGSGLSDFILIWSILIIGVTASAVSSEAGEIADSIMSKSVTRFDYLFAKFSSRILYTLSVFGAITLVLTGLSIKILASDYQSYGLVYSILLVVLTLVMLSTLGVSISVVAPSTVISIIALLALWYLMALFFPVAGLGFLSPEHVAGGLAGNIRGIWPDGEWKTVASYGAISAAAFALSSVYFYFKDI